ncbi:hypothetical protein COHA_005421 [Chlorella ohadii]|uniref:Uncharacterized protein n=1 Tax=Chlorella ohadii TaxID=2649997 RepID=A0AAD5H6A1_9CHLO|nr:hypothetical protein COHA_005421 [Chlorella ohadii]
MPGLLISVASALESQSAGLRAALNNVPSADLALAGAFAVVFGVQRLVPTFEKGWYQKLVKPSWTPPNYVFPLVWIPLKVLQSVSLWLVWRSGSDARELALPLGLFGLHLFLGNWWNVVFFGQHKLEESTKWMAAFWASIAASITAFAQVNPLAALLFAPTQVWVTIAAKLNWDIVQLNKGRQEGGKGGKKK